MSRRTASLLALLAVPLLLIVSLVSIGVAEARSPRSDAEAKAIAIPTITIHSFNFNVPASVRHGAKIKVVNQDGVKHTVTSNKAGKFDVAVPAHSTRYFHAPARAGKYGFHCRVHPSMQATLVVK